MKVKSYWVLSLFIAAALTFAGCGDTATDGGGDTGTTTTETAGDDGGDSAEEGGEEKGGSDAKEGSDSASTEASNSNFQMVSLNVPNMT